VKGLVRSIDKIDQGEARTKKRLNFAQHHFELLRRTVGRVESLPSIGVAPRPARDDGKLDVLASKAKDERAQGFGSEPGINEDSAPDLTTAQKTIQMGDSAQFAFNAAWKPPIVARFRSRAATTSSISSANFRQEPTAGAPTCERIDVYTLTGATSDPRFRKPGANAGVGTEHFLAGSPSAQGLRSSHPCDRGRLPTLPYVHVAHHDERVARITSPIVVPFAVFCWVPEMGGRLLRGNPQFVIASNRGGRDAPLIPMKIDSKT
jgi:hypothetical protein